MPRRTQTQEPETPQAETTVQTVHLDGHWTAVCPACGRQSKPRGSERRALKWLANHAAFAHSANGQAVAETEE